MTTRICYLLSGPAHLPYFLVSLKTLRQHWDGEVEVFAWPQSYDIAKRISEDPHLRFTLQKRTPVRGENRIKKWQFLDKIRLLQTTKTNTIYLDADTTVHDSLEPIVQAVEATGFVATQFNDWLSHNGLARKRIERLRGIKGIEQKWVDLVLNPGGGWPSVNGGVVAAHPDSEILPLWENWTQKAWGIFIPDETVLHILVPKFYPEKMAVMCRGRWNCSPKFVPKTLREDSIAIFHHHGDSMVRPNKSPNSHAMWWPLYQEALAENLGGVREWRMDVNNKWMDKLEGIIR